MLMDMIRTAISKGIHFDYLLTDSWFVNFELIKFIATRRIKCHFLGMLKRGNTNYFVAPYLVAPYLLKFRGELICVREKTVM
jgi:hypothetical protein